MHQILDYEVQRLSRLDSEFDMSSPCPLRLVQHIFGLVAHVEGRTMLLQSYLSSLHCSQYS